MGASYKAVSKGPAISAQLSPAQVGWLLTIPAVAIAVITAVVASPPLGRALFSGTHFDYWPSSQSQLLPKPTGLALYVVTAFFAIAFPVMIAVGHRWRVPIRPQLARRLVLASQVCCIAALVLFWTRQADVQTDDVEQRIYFTAPTIVVAMVLAAGLLWAFSSRSRIERLRAAASAVPAPLWVVFAVVATAAWLLPSIWSDDNIALAPAEITHHLEFSFGETMSVVNGRTPLNDMVMYSTLWPYLVSLPLRWFNESLLAFTTIMSFVTAAAFLAVFDIFRRITRSAFVALSMYLPFIATSLFLIRGTLTARYEAATYYNSFPLRMAGPFLLAWLIALSLRGRSSRKLLTFTFAAATLVVVNNADFGLAAFGATIAAFLCSRLFETPARRRDLLVSAVLGISLALTLVVALTFIRSNSLPQFTLLLRFGRLFGVAGFGNLPTPLLGFHLVILATFVAALATAVALALQPNPDALLNGMLAWAGTFGIGTGAYYVYRSHPDVLILLFAGWGFAVALLAVVTLRAYAARGSGWPQLPEMAVALGLGLMICSLAQFPLPWRQIERIQANADAQPLRWDAAAQFVAAQTSDGEPVAVITSLGHRIAQLSGTTNVTPYTGMWQMPTSEQLAETLSALEDADGNKVFIGDIAWPEVSDALAQRGYLPRAQDETSQFVMYERP